MKTDLYQECVQIGIGEVGCISEFLSEMEIKIKNEVGCISELLSEMEIKLKMHVYVFKLINKPLSNFVIHVIPPGALDVFFQVS